MQKLYVIESVESESDTSKTRRLYVNSIDDMISFIEILIDGMMLAGYISECKLINILRSNTGPLEKLLNKDNLFEYQTIYVKTVPRQKFSIMIRARVIGTLCF